MKDLFKAMRENALLSKRRVAIGVVQQTPALLASLNDAAQFADIIAVGNAVPGFESRQVSGEEAIADQLMSLVRKSEIDAIVRGQVYYTHYHSSMRRAFGFGSDLMCPCLLRDFCGNEWFLTPVVHHDDSSVRGRCYLAKQAARICMSLSVKPVIGVLAADNERGYLTSVDKSLDDAEAIVAEMQSEGYTCEMYPLRIDLAASRCNIVIPMDGILGNFVCRSLTYLGGASLVGGFTLTRRFVSIDTSRSNDEFSLAIEAAVAMCNVGGMQGEEYWSV
jgi:predicted methyltransferase MtxX (methanogen marker protein 4)